MNTHITPGEEGPPTIYIIAGEASGDALGGALIAALKRQSPTQLKFRGIGGPLMTGEGLESLYPISRLSVMGVAEVLPRLPQLLAMIRRTSQDVIDQRPSILITIDAPDFCLRVAKKVAGRGIPVVHYVAPTVWAWKPRRAKKVARYLDHLLALFPFEPPYFEREGMDCSFVGHPVVERAASDGDGRRFRAAHRISPDTPVLCVLPGSRTMEVTRLLPVYEQTLQALKDEWPDLRVVIPTVGHLTDLVRQATVFWPAPVVLVDSRSEKYDAFAASNAALAASGSVALELAAAGLPMVTAYRANAITSWLTKTLVKVRFANLINLLNDHEVVPELLFEACTPGNLAREASRLLSDQSAREAQQTGMKIAIAALRPDTGTPSDKAAEIVLSLIASD